MQPGPESFPPLSEVQEAIIASGAIPTYAWLDGLSEGERHLSELLELLISQGMAGLTLIPDRNWNIPDPETRKKKVAELHKVLAMAREMGLPVLVGTEMNKPGQRILDDFDAEPLRPYREDFIRGANFIYGHTFLQRALGLGYWSDWAKAHLDERRERNAFYTTVGELAQPGRESLQTLQEAFASPPEPEALLSFLQKASK